MSWTKATLVVEARNAADATGSTRWSDTTIIRYADLVFRREWRGILNANPVYRWKSYAGQVTNSSGQIALSGLTTTTDRMYRILDIQQNGYSLKPMQPPHQPYASLTTTLAAPRGWWKLGDNLQVSPAGVVTIDISINTLPKAIYDLADSDTVTFPTDYELILAYETAALMLAKGGLETSAGRDLKGLAEEMRGDMLADVARLSIDPLTFGYPDSPEEWGG